MKESRKESDDESDVPLFVAHEAEMAHSGLGLRGAEGRRHVRLDPLLD